MADINIDWGLAKPQNFFADFQAGEKLGRANHDELAKRKAYNMFATNPDGAEKALLSAGDYEGAAAIGKIRDSQKARATQDAVAPQVAAGNYTDAQKTAVAGGDYKLATAIAGMSEEQRKAEAAKADVTGSLAVMLQDKPYEQRRAIIQANKSDLLKHGYSDQEVDSVDPTDDFLRQAVAHSLGVKGLVAQQNADRSYGLEKDQFSENKRHNKAAEGTAAASAATSAFSAQTGRMSFDERKKAGGFGTPGAGAIYGSTLPDGAKLDP